MKKIILIFALFTFGLVVSAQNERVVVKGETVYEGYIANQLFQEKEVIYRIAYTAFEKNFDSQNAHRQDVIYKEDQIPLQWKEWAEKNGKLEKQGKEIALSLSRISFPGEPTREYYILIDGDRHIRCYCIANDYADVVSTDIIRIERDTQPSTLLTDMNDIVTTLSKSYTGTIIRQIPGKQLQIWDRNSGKINVVDYADIISLRKEPFNPDYSIWQQTPYLERIALKNTNAIAQDGVITEQTMVKDRERTVKLTTKNGIYTYNTKDIQSITRTPNPEYTAIYDIILEPGETRVNRDSLINFVNILKIENPNALTIYYLDPQIIPDENTNNNKLFGKKNKDVATKDLGIVAVSDPTIVIETNTPDIEDVYVIKATELKAILVPKKNPVNILTYTDSDLIRSAIRVKKETSINQTTRLTFKVTEEGFYFIYLRGMDKSWIIQYKKTT